MKKSLFEVLLLFISFASCSSKEIIIDKWGDPKFRDYISWEGKITSERENDIIIPSFSVTRRKKTDDLIKYYKFRVLYFYGQEHNFYDETIYEWTEDTPELIELNKNGVVTIKRTLPAMKREELIKKEGHHLYTEPDGEDLEGLNYKMILIHKE